MALLGIGVWLSTVVDELHLPEDHRSEVIGLVTVPGQPVTAADALEALQALDPSDRAPHGPAVALRGAANEAWFEVRLPEPALRAMGEAADAVLEVSPPWLERVSLAAIEPGSRRVLGGMSWLYGEPGSVHGRIDPWPVLDVPDPPWQGADAAVLLLQARSYGPLMVSVRLLTREQAILRAQARILLAGLLCGALVILLGCALGLMLTSGGRDYASFGAFALMLASATVLLGSANGLVPLLFGAGSAGGSRRALELALCVGCGAGTLVAARWSGAPRASPRVARYAGWSAGAQFAAAAGSAAGAFSALQPAVLALHTGSILVIVGSGIIGLRNRTSLERLNLAMLAAQVGFQLPVKMAFAGLAAPGPLAFHGWQLGTICAAIVVFNSLVGLMREAERSRRLRVRAEVLQARLSVEGRSIAESRDMFRMLSHELRTPLATLCVLARNAEREHPAVSPFSQAMIVQAKRVANLLERVATGESLADMARSGTREPTAVARASREVVGDLRLNWPDRCVLLRTAVSDDTTVGASPEAVRLILANLVENALRHGGPEARVDVHVRGGADHVEFVVSDDGLGIAAEDRELIFKRYWRGRSAMRNPGVGLGLWLVWRVVEGVGGRVRFHASPTGGSVFTVVLPVAGAQGLREATQ